MWVLVLHVVGIFRMLNNRCSPCLDSRLCHFSWWSGAPTDSASLSTAPWEPAHAPASSCLCVADCPTPKVLSSLLSPGKEQVPALASCHVSRRDLPHVNYPARERKALAQHKWLWESGGWVTIQPSHLCSLGFPMTTEAISLEICLCYGCGFLPDRVPLGYRRQDLDGKGSGITVILDFSATRCFLTCPRPAAFAIPGFF